MRFLIVVLLACAAACGTEPDPRPVTFEVIAYEVLQPSCGAIYCHSTATQTRQLAFDTLDATRTSVKRHISVILDVIDRQTMPPDSPMDARDVALLQAWVDAGEPGL
jgi:predicted CxxxxCH...CXXCH cytochrome family protein